MALNAGVQALVLAGGKGSRSLNPDLPKILQQVGPESRILDLHLENLAAAGVHNVAFLVNHGASIVESAVNRALARFPNLTATFIHDEGHVSTFSIVKNAIGFLPKAEEYLLVLGDTVISAPVDLYLSLRRNRGAGAAVLAHPNLHISDSDRVWFDRDYMATGFCRKSTQSDDTLVGMTLPLTGLLLFTQSFFEGIGADEGDLTQIIAEHGVSTRDLSVIVASHYFKDSGTPSRLARINSDYASGVLQRRGNANRPAIFIDRDGTMLPDIGSQRTTLNDHEIPIDVAQAIRSVNEVGIPICLVTNQPGIAKGEITFRQIYAISNAISAVLESHGAFLDDYAFCPHHPHGGFAGELPEFKILCTCRKPATGMVDGLAVVHELDIAKSFVIGDTERDSGLAQAAGASFLLASFDGHNGMATSRAIYSAVERILSDHH